MIEILAAVGICALVVLIIGTVHPNPDQPRIDRLNAKRERERIRARERAARIRTRGKGGAS